MACRSYTFLDIERRFQRGRDYRILWRLGRSSVLVMAPHGGWIEPGTTCFADAIASRFHGFYSFEGLRPSCNRTLHISSTSFDEPVGRHLVRIHHVVVTVHGCRGFEPKIYLGGLADELRERCLARLKTVGVDVGEHPVFKGYKRENICNGGQWGAGLQLEMTTGFRDLLYRDGEGSPWPKRTRFFWDVIKAIQSSLAGTVP